MREEDPRRCANAIHRWHRNSGFLLVELKPADIRGGVRRATQEGREPPGVPM
jgi:hypothetical protein